MAANPSIQLGTDGNWAIKENNLLAYKKDGNRFFNKEFDFTRATSATRVNKQSLIETVAIDKPRIDYTDSLTSPSFLLEPQSTNVLENSEITSTWTYTEFGSGSSGTITTGKTDMFGSTNAAQIDFPADAENVTLTFGQTASSISSGSASSSVYIKLVESGSKTLQLRCSPNLTTLINVDETKFVRYELSGTKSASEAFSLKLRPSAGTSSGGFSIIVCQPQEEALSYPTSYIPTNGSTVTRNQEVCNNSGTVNDFNSEEGVLYAEIAALTDVDGDASLRFITLSNGTSSKRITIYYFSSETFGVQLKNDGYELTDLYIGGSVDRTQFNKIALYYSGSNVKAYLNGIEVFTNSSWVPFSANTINTLTFTGGALSDSPFYGNVKSVAVFKRALTDAELQELTT